MTIRSFGVALAVAMCVSCGVAEAAPPFAPVIRSAYSYYNRPGAEMNALDSDLADCALTVGNVSVPRIGGGLAFDAMARLNENAFSRASMENCMVARDWRVVSVTKEEGAQWAALPVEQLNALLNPMVGAVEPHGEIVRTFSNVVMKMPNGLTAIWPYPSRYSLSDARLDWDKVHREMPKRLPAPKFKIKFLKSVSPDKAGPVPADKAMLVIRLVAGEKNSGRMLNLTRLPDVQDGVDVVENAHARTAGGIGQEQISIFNVTPGLWYLGSVVLTQTCLGAPAFEAKAGETIFLGSFHFGDSLKLDPSLPPEQVAIPADIKARMRAAEWKNGLTYPCTGIYATAVRFDGAPNGNFGPEVAQGAQTPAPR